MRNVGRPVSSLFAIQTQHPVRDHSKSTFAHFWPILIPSLPLFAFHIVIFLAPLGELYNRVVGGGVEVEKEAAHG